jgi:hypothetical protein
MKSIFTLLTASFAVIFFSASARVTFNVDMQNAVKDTSFHFNTATGTVDVDGNFTKWSSLKMNSIGTSTIYTVNIDTLKDGYAVEFKFRANGSTSEWKYAEFPKGGANRKFTIKNGLQYSMNYNDTAVKKTNISSGIAGNDEVLNRINLFPNPASGQVHISYNMVKAGNLSIKVYNILGSEVKNLLAENENPGSKKNTFDISDLNNGLFFYVIQVNGTNLASGKFQVTN